MSNSRKKNPEAPSRHISKEATLELWVKSGGRCALCNKFLLEEPFFEREINLAERAHIAGWTSSGGSPRGESSLPLPERGEAKNLILLCTECHKIVDDRRTRGDYPEERLLEIKREHEDRIFHLTAMGRDRETAVLRVFGSIRGSLPEMARNLAMQTVIDGAGRYARFPLAVDRHSIEIDLSSLPDPELVGRDAYWSQGRHLIDRALERVAEAVHQKHIRHVSIFALSRIPLLVYLGFALDDKVPVDLYQKHRGESEGWIWPEDGEAVEFDTFGRREGEGEDVVLILSLSGSIPLNDLPDDLNGFPIYEIRPRGEAPNPNLFRRRSTLDAFARSYQDFLAHIEITHPSVKRLHLFPSVPITAAITCGRSLMRHVQPELWVYDRIGPQFNLALRINER